MVQVAIAIKTKMVVDGSWMSENPFICCDSLQRYFRGFPELTQFNLQNDPLVCYMHASASFV